MARAGDLMRHVKQVSTSTCGQACIAMACNVPIEVAIKEVGGRGRTFGKNLIGAIRRLGTACGPVMRIHAGTVLPIRCVVTTRKAGARVGHWVVFNETWVHDPLFPKRWPREAYQKRMQKYGRVMSSFIKLP